MNIKPMNAEKWIERNFGKLWYALIWGAAVAAFGAAQAYWFWMEQPAEIPTFEKAHSPRPEDCEG